MKTNHKILNFGSLNIDQVYRVDSFVRPGETLAAKEYHRYPGGKGLNQSIALARAGMDVIHAGCIGEDGLFLKAILESDNIDVSMIEVLDGKPSGHAFIQVADSGENAIVLFGGTNHMITQGLVSKALAVMDKGDFMLMQNEISLASEIIDAAYEKGLRIFMNPAPMTQDVASLPLEKLEMLIVNETEGAQLAGTDDADDYWETLCALRGRYPSLNILMTLGARGSVYASCGSSELVRVPANRVVSVTDTTAAGDTFIGYFIEGLADGLSPAAAMNIAAKASAICVTRNGAATSIPFAWEL